MFLSICVCDDLALGVVSNCEFYTSTYVKSWYNGDIYKRTVNLYSFISPNETDLTISTLSLFMENDPSPSNANITVSLYFLDNNHLPNTSITSFTETISFDSIRYYNYTHFKDYTLEPLQPYGIIIENRDYIPEIRNRASTFYIGSCDNPPSVTSEKNFTFLDFATQFVDCANFTECPWDNAEWNSAKPYYALMLALYTSTITTCMN